MSTMVTAGPPAPPGHDTPRLLRLPGGSTVGTPSRPGRLSPGAGQVPDDAPSAAPGVADDQSAPSAFARLTAHATFRVPDVADTDGPRGTVSWHDPDPEAGLRLGEGLTPFDRAVKRWREGVSRDRARTKFRMVKRHLLGDMRTPVDTTDLRAYPWHQITVEDAEDFHRAIYRYYGPQSTRNDYVCTLRVLVTQCYQAGLISALRREELLEVLYTITPGRSTRRHRITDAEFDALLDVCLTTGTKFVRARNSAAIALFRTTGLRVSELVNIDLTGWDRREDVIHLPATKNNDPHVLFVHPATKVLLIEWLAVRGTDDGKLFRSSRGPADRAMATEAIRYMLKSRCKRAGIPEFGTHDFRRTFATEMLRQYDAALVSKLLNHRKLSSTLIYDMTTDDEMRNAVGSIDLTSRRIGGAA